MSIVEEVISNCPTRGIELASRTKAMVLFMVLGKLACLS